jgi:hypothetical protein
LRIRYGEIHRRGAEGAEEAQRKTIPNLGFEISGLNPLRPLCVLCASAVSLTSYKLKSE